MVVNQYNHRFDPDLNCNYYSSTNMRILCLHGFGSSGDILEKQMASLRRELDASFELVFVDGQFESERGPGQ